MPAQYEAIRDALIASGKPTKEAKAIAAATWNKRHPSNPNPWTHETAKREAILHRLTKR